MVDRGRAGDAVEIPDARRQAVLRDRAGRRVDHDVGAERELRVDPGLPVVGCREDAEVDSEGKQERGHHEATVDRGSSSAGAGEQESRCGLRALAGHATRDPRHGAAAGAHEEQRRA